MNLLRKILPYTGFAILLAALYTGYTFYSRYSNDKLAQRRADAEEARVDRQNLDRIGGGDLKILNLYASPPQISRGEKSQLCYSVAFAKSVDIEPPVGEIWPSLAKCVAVNPRRSTEYKLTASDEKGKSVTKSALLTVQ